MRKLVALVIIGQIVWLAAGALPPCVVDRAESLPGNGFLNTNNNATYMCTLDMLQELYNPANIACGQTEIEDGSSGSVAQFQCPQPDTTVKCVLTMGWGSVAGSCSTCNDACSLEALGGEDSCCGVACMRDGRSGDCQQTEWIPASAGGCGSEYSDGYCNCCPECGDCLTSPLGSDRPGSGLDSSFCDCRNGLETSLDWAPCWNSCMDCFGDNAPAGEVVYPPAELVSECVGSGACYVGILLNSTSPGPPLGMYASCTSLDAGSCTPVGQPSSVINGAKMKGLVLCG